MYETGKYGGGLVQPAVPRYFRLPVITLDFAGLYPSIMRAENICPTTFVGREEQARAMGLAAADCTVSPSGWWFVKEHVRKGMLSEVLEDLTNARAGARKKMKGLAPGSAEYEYLDSLQKAIKVANNSQYGVQGASTNSAGCMAVAESVTAFGRLYITRVNEYLAANYPDELRLVYGDTDSSFLECAAAPPASALTPAGASRCRASARAARTRALTPRRTSSPTTCWASRSTTRAGWASAWWRRSTRRASSSRR